MAGKTSKSFRLGFVNIEDRQKLGDCHQLTNALGHIQQFDLAALLPQGNKAGNEFSQAAGVNIGDSRQVQKDPGLIFLSQRVNRFVQSHGASADPQPAFQIEHCHISGAAFIDVEIYHVVQPYAGVQYMSNVGYSAGRQYLLYVVNRDSEASGFMIEIRLDGLLKQHGRTFYWLAKETGISHTTLWRLKKAKALGINFDTMEKICQALHCKPGDVLTMSKNGNRKSPSKKAKKLTGKKL